MCRKSSTFDLSHKDGCTNVNGDERSGRLAAFSSVPVSATLELPSLSSQSKQKISMEAEAETEGLSQPSCLFETKYPATACKRGFHRANLRSTFCLHWNIATFRFLSFLCR